MPVSKPLNQAQLTKLKSLFDAYGADVLNRKQLRQLIFDGFGLT